MILDKHALAILSLVGSFLDLLGALYLAYDLLGGENGPLRTLTRGVTYGVIFGVSYGLALGPAFGIAAAVSHGITLAWEFSRAARNAPKPGFWFDVGMSTVRAFAFGLGTAFLFGPRFGIAFGAFSAVGQVIAYRLGIRPTIDYAPAARPRITRFQILGALNRALGYAAAGYISALLGNQRAKALGFGLEVGLLIGVVTVMAGFCTPLIEWIASRLPPKSMGVAGATLIFTGFALQSIQYWVALLDLPVK